jgi:hypothetical protein
VAGDWIKMRAELLTHPRFIALCNNLIYGENPGLLVYTCGEDALEIGVMPPSNETVTNRALRCVTVSALRDVTLVTLLKTWCSVNAHCKVDGADGILTPASVSDIDDIAGFVGFGEALEAVGWVSDDGDNTLIFPNFLEFNEPACLRCKPMSNAERQAKYRQKKSETYVNSDNPKSRVTKVTKSNAREEKRRDKEIPNGISNQGKKATAEEIYQLYPKRVGKADAIKAIVKALSRVDAEVLREAVTAYSAARAGQDAQFTPNPATWFNQDRWTDDRSTWNGTVRSGGQGGSSGGGNPARYAGTYPDDIAKARQRQADEEAAARAGGLRQDAGET